MTIQPAAPNGRDAINPWAMPWQAWRAVLLRTWNEAGDDNVGLVAAGVAFYGFLALVPLLGAVVLSYGLVADPATVIGNVRGLMSVMPADAAKLIGEQLLNVVATSGEKKGFGLLLALALAVFGARSAAGAIVTALNIAYEEKERRSFIMVNLLALGITGAGVLVMVLAVIAIAALGHLEDMLPTMPEPVMVAGKIASYLALVLAGAAGAATLYRYGPSRERPRWVWLTPGSLLAALLGLALTFGFGIYVANFGNYNATYGSLGAVVVMLTWLYLSSYLLLFGAELNAELEHQSAQDTTHGAAAPLGERGAWVADHVAGQQPDDQKDAPAIAGSDIDDGPSDASRTAVLSDVNIRQEPSLPARLISLYVGPKLGKIAGGGGAGLVAPVLGGVGFSLLRRRGRARLGIVAIAAAAVLGLAGRSSDT